jgi:RNA polymerase sigma-70 factor (ECF subfamily)
MVRAKVDASDIVQETLMRAHERRGQFRGETEAERLAWLRRILANTLADVHRRYARAKRKVALERSLEQALEQSSLCLGKFLADDAPTPSSRDAAEWRQVRLADALAQLPEAQRLAVSLRYLRDPPCPLAEIARQLGRTEKAAAGLVCRGLQMLRQIMGESEER